MSKREDRENSVDCVIVAQLGGHRFTLKRSDTGEEIIGYISGNMRMKRIRVCIGDTVQVVIDPFGGRATNKIIWRK